MTAALDLSRPCTRCGAQVDQLCIGPRGDRMYGVVHRARVENPPRRGRPRKAPTIDSGPGPCVDMAAGPEAIVDGTAAPHSHSGAMGAMECDVCNPEQEGF